MTKLNRTPVDLLEHEFAQERASALGRLGRAFEAALAALTELDARMAGAEVSPASRELRAALVQEASTALWHFIVQREACGLRDMRYVLREYRVPSEVSSRMGMTVSVLGQPERPG
ncbi:MAG TPA: DUF6665 family protein [Xanthobacteraceae bacterium]|jgi:hypothetical protein